MRTGPAILLASGAALFSLGIALPKLVSALEPEGCGPASEPLEPIKSDSSVDVIVPAYLERSVIAATIASVQDAAARYPGSVRVCVVASDPETAAAARTANADVVVDMGRGGKAAAINAGVALSSADLIVLTDANCVIRPDDWLQRAVQALRTHSVVSGNKRETQGQEGAFWRVEEWIKTGRGGTGLQTLSVVGEFICLRRADFSPIPVGVILDDYSVARSLARLGKSSVVDPGIFTEEEAAPPAQQWERRVRIAQGVLEEIVPDAPWLIGSPIGRFHLAHKVYRMTIGCMGFWMAVAGAALIAVPVSVLTLPLVLLAVLAYSGRIGRMGGGPLAAAIGMQAVPVAGLMRTLVSRARHAPRTGWEKAAR